MKPLPTFDRNLLLMVERIVPADERAEWTRGWRAELWHGHYYGRTYRATTELTAGLIRDALWLRGESWRRAFSGTATLCLASLIGMVTMAGLLAIALHGGIPALRFDAQVKRFLLEAPLVLFVSFATSSRRHTQQGRGWLKRQTFLWAKTALVLMLAAVLGWDVCQPLEKLLPLLADILQILCFVAFALVGLRWTFADQELRCKQCLRLLATPARVGRPSHNLLEWSGTELVCKQGHGLLSVPEMETSWCQTSEWVSGGWDGAALG
jgi:hypothetical protein